MHSDTPTTTVIPKAGIVSRVASTYSEFSGWKKMLLTIAMMCMAVGGAGAGYGLFRDEPQEVQAAQKTIEEFGGTHAGNNLTGTQKAEFDAAINQVNDFKHWFFDRSSPHLWRMGLGFFTMFIVGYVFRQFVKTAAMLTAGVIAIATVASYFGWIELSSVKSGVASTSEWVWNQLYGVKDTLMRWIGASLTGTTGFVVGFMKR